MHKFLVEEAEKANLNFDSEELPYHDPIKIINTEDQKMKFLGSASAKDFTMFLVET